MQPQVCVQEKEVYQGKRIGEGISRHIIYDHKFLYGNEGANKSFLRKRSKTPRQLGEKDEGSVIDSSLMCNNRNDEERKNGLREYIVMLHDSDEQDADLQIDDSKAHMRMNSKGRKGGVVNHKSTPALMQQIGMIEKSEGQKDAEYSDEEGDLDEDDIDEFNTETPEAQHYSKMRKSVANQTHKQQEVMVNFMENGYNRNHNFNQTDVLQFQQRALIGDIPEFGAKESLTKKVRDRRATKF